MSEIAAFGDYNSIAVFKSQDVDCYPQGDEEDETPVGADLPQELIEGIPGRLFIGVDPDLGHGDAGYS